MLNKIKQILGLKDPEEVRSQVLAAIGQANDYSNAGRHEDAIDCCDEALLLDKKFLPTSFVKANSLHNLGRYEEVVSCCNKAIKFNPQFDTNFAGLWATKGEAELNLKLYDDAEISYKKFLEIVPNDPTYEEMRKHINVSLIRLQHRNFKPPKPNLKGF